VLRGREKRSWGRESWLLIRGDGEREIKSSEPDKKKREAMRNSSLWIGVSNFVSKKDGSRKKGREKRDRVGRWGGVHSSQKRKPKSPTHQLRWGGGGDVLVCGENASPHRKKRENKKRNLFWKREPGDGKIRRIFSLQSDETVRRILRQKKRSEHGKRFLLGRGAREETLVKKSRKLIDKAFDKQPPISEEKRTRNTLSSRKNRLGRRRRTRRDD